MIRRWLAKAPVLLTAYFAWVNRERERRWIGPLAALTIMIVWPAAVLLYVHSDRIASIQAFRWLGRHDLLWASIFAVASGALVLRRRSLNRIAYRHSWTAALPVKRSTNRWQWIAMESAPVALLLGFLALMFGTATAIGIVDASLPVPLITCAAAAGGVTLGAVLGHLMPLTRQEDGYEASRYVPHRRGVETPAPTGSLGALGSWPLRQLFASARPKTLARAMIPVLLSVPLGSAAADTMLAVGLLAAIGALVLLTTATISVSAAAFRWLTPVPLAPRVLARRVAGPPLAVVVLLTSIESWLTWVLGSTIARCLLIGMLMAAACAILTMGGSLLAVHPRRQARHGRV